MNFVHPNRISLYLTIASLVVQLLFAAIPQQSQAADSKSNCDYFLTGRSIGALVRDGMFPPGWFEKSALKDKTVLDLAGGIFGLVSLQLRLKGIKSYSLDQAGIPGFGLIRRDMRKADARHMPFPDNYFDIIYTSFGPLSSTYSDENPELVIEILQEVRRVLKPDGVLRTTPSSVYRLGPLLRRAGGLEIDPVNSDLSQFGYYLEIRKIK